MKLVLAAILLATPAVAQQNCAPLDAVNERLKEKYGETLKTVGTANNGMNVVSQYANAETGTWTILVINPNGTACVVSVGQNWRPVVIPNGDPA